jgi:hypothetical protein
MHIHRNQTNQHNYTSSGGADGASLYGVSICKYVVPARIIIITTIPAFVHLTDNKPYSIYSVEVSMHSGVNSNKPMQATHATMHSTRLLSLFMVISH